MSLEFSFLFFVSFSFSFFFVQLLGRKKGLERLWKRLACLVCWLLNLLADMATASGKCFSMQAGSELNLRHTCSKIVLILSTSQSIKYRFSCLLSISSMMRLNSWMSFMFPTDLAVTCQLFCTAASIIACRMENPEGRKNSYTIFFLLKKYFWRC